jgi:hypothetical protein
MIVSWDSHGNIVPQFVIFDEFGVLAIEEERFYLFNILSFSCSNLCRTPVCLQLV